MTPERGIAVTRDTNRLVGPDVVRAIALIGVVVMNFHGYLIIDGGERSTNFWGRQFDPWNGPLSTRFAATFVLTAGVGVTLLTRRAIGDAALTSARRWTLVRRGLLLYGFGIIYDEIWPGSILPFYGAMFVLGALIFTLATPWLIGIGLTAALAGAGIKWWVAERTMDGHSTTWLTNPGSNSPRGHLLDVMVNGTHPLLPWLAFFCAGMVIGRLLRTDWWRPAVLAISVTLFGLATAISGAVKSGEPTQLAALLSSTDPLDRGLLYVASALGTALVAFAAISWVAEAFSTAWPTVLLARAGQMTLTLYIIHGLVFNYITHWNSWVEPSGLDLALTFAAIYWIIAIVLGWLWHRRFGIGPAEWLYRKLGA